MAASLPIQVTTGILCASYWRGAWYVLDHLCYPHDRFKSGVVSLTLGSLLLGMKQYILSPSYNGTKMLVRLLPPPKHVSIRTRYIQTNRFIILYGIASACILLWRGTWLLWDEAAHVAADTINKYKTAEQLKKRQLLLQQHGIEHHGESTVTEHEDIDENVLFYSGIVSHVLATGGLLMMGRFASVMAPPAQVSMLTDMFIHSKGKSFLRTARLFGNSLSEPLQKLPKK